MAAPTVVVVNPNSRSGATGRRWHGIEALLRERLGPLTVEATRGPRDAERIAREHARAGARRIVVAGGDGTTSEVVTGLLTAGLADGLALGFLPLGTGGDVGRTLGTPRSLAAAVERLARGKSRRVDAGRAVFTPPDGGPRTLYFLNVASAGLSGLVDRLVNEAPKALGGTGSFLVGTLRGLVRYRDVSCTVRVDGETLHRGPVVLAAAANGRFFGGGMEVAPRARPDDGLLDAVVVAGAPRWRLLASLPRLYRGRHLDRPEVSFRQGRRVEIEPDGVIWLDVDGEPFAARHAAFDLLPGAVTVLSGDG